MQIAKKKKKGFTLIELLVVIAIIGILASIVLVSLSGAKNRAKDARITADLNQVRSMGELISSSDGNYSAVLTNADVNTIYTDISAQGGANILRTGDVNGYCMEVKLLSGKWGCVNSGLIAKFDLANDPACAGNANGASTNTMCQ